MSSDQGHSFAADGLYCTNYFGGSASSSFQKALDHVRRHVSHPLYHEWRLWTACQIIEQQLHAAISNEQDFVYIEAGVGEGHTILTLLAYISRLDNDKIKRKLDASHFVFLDTFSGVDASILTREEESQAFMESAYGATSKEIFAERLKVFNAPMEQVRIIKGSVPSTLNEIPRALSLSCRFLHIDMNNIAPEIGTLSYFMPSLAPGSLILLDDYGFMAHKSQRIAIDQFLRSRNYPMPISLPTGQGLILR